MTNTETATRTTILGRWLVPVLLIEDNPADIRLTLEASSACGLTRLEVITDGDTALAYLRHQPPYQDAPRPALVLLDLNLPGVDGRHVLTAIKTDPDLHTKDGAALGCSGPGSSAVGRGAARRSGLGRVQLRSADGPRPGSMVSGRDSSVDPGEVTR
jgi:CheY-like chemotaxis protein